MAAVGDDVGERRACVFGRCQVGRELVEADVVVGAGGAVDQRVEVDERVAPGHVGVARDAAPGRGRRSPSAGWRQVVGWPRRAVADVLDVGLPRRCRRRSARRRASASSPGTRSRRRRPGRRSPSVRRRDVGVGGAVGRRLRGRALAADQRDLVGQLALRHRVVVGQQLALCRSASWRGRAPASSRRTRPRSRARASMITNTCLTGGSTGPAGGFGVAVAPAVGRGGGGGARRS